MIEWRRIPWTLWVYAAISLWPAALVEVRAHGPILVMVLFPALIFAWLYFLLDGVRWVWVVSVAIGVLGLVLEVVSASLDWHDALSLIGLMLLLLPVTRRYFSTGRTAAVA